MKCYQFYEATPLLKFIEVNRDNLIGHALFNCSNYIWRDSKKYYSDEPFVLELDTVCLIVNYLFLSDLQLCIGKKDEVLKSKKYGETLRCLKPLSYYFDKYSIETEKEADYTIVGIEVERFSEAFECESSSGTIRPAGGDYFSTIRLTFSNGRKFCFCGDKAEADGYVVIWTE